MSDRDVGRISAGELIARMSAAGGGSACLIDVRTEAEYDAVHASGAKSFPLDRLDGAAVMESRPVGGDGRVYLICKSGQRAVKAARRLLDAGLSDVCVVEGGTEAWVAAGGPVARGTAGVISIDRQFRIAMGVLLLVGTGLASWVHPWFWAWPAFLGAGLVFSGVTDFCGMALILARAPWNRRRRRSGDCCGVISGGTP